MMPEPERPQPLDAWIGLVRRRWRTGVGVGVALLALVAVLLFTAAPVYRAEARLRLSNPPPMPGVSATGGLFGLFGLGGGDPFSNDLELIRSRTLAEGVVDDVSLNARLIADRDVHRDTVFAAFSADRSTVEATYRVEWGREGVRVVELSGDTLVASGPPGAVLGFGGVSLVALPRREGRPERVEISTIPFADAVRSTSRSIETARPRREANVVDVAYEHSDPAVTRAVVASVVERFVELRTLIQRRESGVTVDSLQRVSDRTLAELTAAESAMEALQREERMVAPAAQGEAFVERFATLQAELESARQEVASIDAMLARVRSASDPGREWTELASYPRFFQNETVGALLTRLTELEQERAELASRRQAENRELRVVAEQMAFLDGSLRSLARGYREAVAERIPALEAQVAAMDARLAAVPAQAVELGRRQRDVRILSEVLVLTEQRLRQEQLREALTFANVQVIDGAALLPDPVWPRKRLGLVVGLLLAGFFGLLAMVVRERADPTVRRAAQIREVVGAPLLAVAPRHGGELALSPGERRAVLAGAAGGEGGPLMLSPAGPGAAATELAHTLSGNGDGPPGENGGGVGVVRSGVEITPRVDTLAAAAEARAGRVVVVVECGRTRTRDLRRSVTLLREAGAEIAGVIVVCDDPKEMAAIWR